MAKMAWHEHQKQRDELSLQLEFGADNSQGPISLVILARSGDRIKDRLRVSGSLALLLQIFPQIYLQLCLHNLFWNHLVLL
jgi:hypothetical protein